MNLPIREKSNLECFVVREGTCAHLKYEFKFCSMLYLNRKISVLFCKMKPTKVGCNIFMFNQIKTVESCLSCR